MSVYSDLRVIHRREITLLSLAGAFLLVNAVLLLGGPAHSGDGLWLFMAWAAAAITGHQLLDRVTPQRDPFFYPIIMLLSGWGLLTISRLAPGFAWRQTLWLFISLGLLLAINTLPSHLRWLRRYRYSWLLGGLTLLVITIVLGVNPTDPERSIANLPRLWLGFGGIYFQPSELLKIVLVVFLASYLADHRDSLRRPQENTDSWRVPLLRVLGPLILMWGITVIVVIWQRDLGTATLFFIIFLTILYVASGRMLYLITGLALLVLAALAAYYLFDVVQLRVDVWLNPWPEANDRAFQIVQSLMAFAAGGIVGQGIGFGSPGYVPVVHSDFIFSAIGEEWGLIGTLCVIVCLSVLVTRGFRLAALWAGSHFNMLLVTGLTVLLGTQSLLIMGGALKLIPLTGVTLPFMSYGGSSLLMNFTLVGLLISLSSSARADGTALQSQENNKS